MSTPPSRNCEPRSGTCIRAVVTRRSPRVARPGGWTAVAPRAMARSCWCRCFATTWTRTDGFSWCRASTVSSPTVPAPTTTTRAPAGMSTRRTEWIAQASGSTSTARSSGNVSGTGCSREAWATSCRLQPPPVSAQKPVCRPAESTPVVTWSQRLSWPDWHHRHCATPRGSQDRTGSRTTRVPFGTSGSSSRVSPTISCPGTNGIDVIGDRYGDD